VLDFTTEKMICDYIAEITTAVQLTCNLKSLT